MGPFRRRQNELTHLAAVVSMLEQVPLHEVVANDSFVVRPQYWIARLDVLLASGPLSASDEQVGRLLRLRLERLASRWADPGNCPA